MSEDFRTLLSTPMDEIKRPSPKPAGTYNAIVQSYSFDKSSRKGTPYIRYVFQGVEPGADIDASLLEGVNMDSWNPHLDFWLTPESMYILKNFLESCGVEFKGRNMGECIPEAVNARVMLTVTQRTSEDGKDIYSDVRSAVGLSE